MKKLMVAVITAVLFTFLASSTAQVENASIGYVDSQHLLSLHSLYPQAVALNERAREELTAISQRAQELYQRSQSAVGLTPEEQEELSVTLMTLDTTTQRYDAETEELMQPAVNEVTEAITLVARSLGLTMVFDLLVAAESGLVVFAEPSLDITQLVEEHLYGQQ